MLKLNAYAKVNLTMDVLGKRADGYHDVDLLMQSIDLCDELIIAPADALHLTVIGGVPKGEDNLVMRAARALQMHVLGEKGAHITLVKRIPVAAGLGGGSADAAAVLVGLNALWALDLSTQELMRIGGQLGADIPFCIQGGLARATGIGCDLTPLSSCLNLHIVLFKPCDGLLTREVFAALDVTNIAHRPHTHDAIRALEKGDVKELCDSMGNVLEPISCARRPEIGLAIVRLAQLGAVQARMSGSGSAVFGLFMTKEAALRAQFALCQEGQEATYAVNMPMGVQITPMHQASAYSQQMVT